MQQTHLHMLSSMVWQSPLFGDTFPYHQHSRDMERVNSSSEQIAQLLEKRFAILLAQWMHPISEARTRTILDQVIPKSVAFCAGLALDMTDDIERCTELGLSIALVYWIDHCMDRGDKFMEQAIPVYCQHSSDSPHLHPAVKQRMIGLQALQTSIATLSHSEDTEILYEHVLQEVLQREAELCQYSRLHHDMPYHQFWSEYGEAVAVHSIRDGALFYVTAALYTLLRHHYELPPLAQIIANPAIMAFIDGPAATLIRLIDDWGDRLIDTGDDPAWGVFSLNVFNQPHAIWVATMLQHAGIHSPSTRSALFHAFQNPIEANYISICQKFVEALRTALAALSNQQLTDAEWLFITLAKRVLEAGYVNALGDQELTNTEYYERTV